MKLICAEYNGEGDRTVSIVGDNALLRNNNDFYFPVFTETISCVPQLVFRSCKLGKSIAEKFAHRYYDQIGVGIRFYADSLEKELRDRKLPALIASSFDNSAAISLLENYENQIIEFEFWVNETLAFKENISEVSEKIDTFIYEASQFCMLKIGDLIFCGNTFRYTNIKIGDRLRIIVNGKCMMDFQVK